MELKAKHDIKSNALTISFLVIIVIVTIAASSKVAAPGEHTETYSYVPNSTNVNQSLDLTLPEKQMPGVHTTPPLVVWIHGGAWQEGDKAQNAAIGLVDQGFAVASLNYRLTKEAKFPAQIDDCRAAIKFLRENAKKYHYDADRIGIFGGSAGGHLASLLGLTDKVQAVCDWNGVTDFKTVLKQAPDEKWKNEAVARLLGGLPDAVPEIAAKASPLTYVSAKAPPFLIVHGNADKVVPYAQSIELYDALKKVGADVQMLTIEKGTHNIFVPEAQNATAKFFIDKLKP